MNDVLLRWLVGGGCAVVAVLSTICTVLITPRRTYYPLLRVLFAVTAGIYTASAVAQYFGTPQYSQVVRISAMMMALGMLTFSVFFIARRNYIPEWMTHELRHLTGAEEIDFDNIDVSLMNSLSLIRHGAASRDTAAQFYEALRQWEIIEEGRQEMRRQLDERRARNKRRNEEYSE